MCGLTIFLGCICGSYSSRGFFLVIVVRMVVLVCTYYVPGTLLNVSCTFSRNLTT